MTEGEKLNLIINLIVVIGTVVASYVLIRERIVKLETRMDANDNNYKKLREDHDDFKDDIKRNFADLRELIVETKTMVQILAKKAEL